ncbi:fibronectin type III domain-containing protein [Geomonas oryzae]|jgi:hypothetical protein|uniref:fibronectin type III domain-containing protein n=1 Tax=Geomonas oryzae TaxID=2364273 RepID=UPI00100AF976|nr:fibronectin type III domain-containing protein [Geomonas oryzae]
MSEIFNIPGLKSLSDGELAVQGENVADHLDEHEAFQEDVKPGCVPGGDQVRGEAQEVKRTSYAAKQDPTKEPECQAARDKLIQSIRFSSQYAVMYSVHVNKPSLLDTIGVDRVHKTPRATGVKVPNKKFDRFKVTHGKKSGTIKIYVNSWEGKGSVVVQICYGDPTQEDSWQHLKLSHYCHFTQEGLEPARRAYFRARLENDAGIGPWSDVVELIIL